MLSLQQASSHNDSFSFIEVQLQSSSYRKLTLKGYLSHFHVSDVLSTMKRADNNYIVFKRKQTFSQLLMSTKVEHTLETNRGKTVF